MKVLIVLYEGFTEYEYLIPVLAFDHFEIPFDTVGLEEPDITGMTGLKISLARTLAEVDTGDYDALLLPGVDRSTRERAMQNENLMELLREYDQAGVKDLPLHRTAYRRIGGSRQGEAIPALGRDLVPDIASSQTNKENEVGIGVI